MITVTHTAVAVGADDPTKEINAGEWNAVHTLGGSLALTDLPTPDSCKLTNSVDISIPHNTTTILTYNTETWDAQGMHAAGDPSKITIQRAGKYLVISRVPLDATGINANVEVTVLLNGTATVVASASGVTSAVLYDTFPAIGLYQFAVNDYIQTKVYQYNGGTTTYPVSAVRVIEFSVIRVSD